MTLFDCSDESLFTAEIILILVFIHSNIHKQQSYEDVDNEDKVIVLGILIGVFIKKV